MSSLDRIYTLIYLICGGWAIMWMMLGVAWLCVWTYSDKNYESFIKQGIIYMFWFTVALAPFMVISVITSEYLFR